MKKIKQFISTCLSMYLSFEKWFDTRFSWFFTNGMKQNQMKNKDKTEKDNVYEFKQSA
ncbi:MAG: hypothetical protein MRY83_02445 [Flavobacteriales bacterium]|nr:hypothetical protein [Flavobacteriales bacterium]